MKRIISVLLVLTFVFILVGCNLENEGEDMTNSPYFTGKVLEKYEGSCLLEVTDEGNAYMGIGNLVVVRTNIEKCPEYEVGDYLTITFDGRAAQSYPPQIFNVFSVVKASE